MKTLIFTLIGFLFLTTVLAQDSLNGNRTDSIQNGIKTGYLLPEVLISDELQLKTLADDEISDRAEDFQKAEFKMYALKTEQAIAKNENDISVIKSKLKAERGKVAIKHWRLITTLEIENEQLKTDLWNYLHYGLGNWSVFKSEFNEELRPLANDIESLKNELSLTP